MKEIIIIILILLIINISGIYVQMYLNSTSEELVSNLEYIRRIINNNSNKEDINILKDECNKLYDKWKKIDKGWSIVVLHEEMDSIEKALIKTKVNIEEEKLDDAMVEIEESIFLIRHIPEKESLRIKNIF